MREITFELTNYCPHQCNYCSSNVVDNIFNATQLRYDDIKTFLQGKTYDRIHLSGGEPLSHYAFYSILLLCEKHAKDVVVHTNAFKHIIFNANVIDNIYIESNITVTGDVDKVNILKRVEQGKEKTRPEVHFSGNWTNECENCDQQIMRSDGKLVPSPCKKD